MAAVVVDLRWQSAQMCGKMVKRRQIADELGRGLAEGLKDGQAIFPSFVRGQRQGGLEFGNAQSRFRD